MKCKAGDIVLFKTGRLFRDHDFFGWAIKRVQKRIGFTPFEAQFKHVAIVTSSAGDILHSLGRTGVVKGDISEYSPDEYIILRMPNADGARVASAAKELAGLKKYAPRAPLANLRRPKYDWSLILALWLVSLGLPKKIIHCFNLADYYICTEFVLAAYKYANYEINHSIKRFFPAYLARKILTDKFIEI